MNHHFKDITDRLGAPLWFDALGYPRYCIFGPRETSNIYANVVFLVEIACQDCHHKMDVSNSFDHMDMYRNDFFKNKWEEVRKQYDIPEGKLVFGKHWKDFFNKFSKEELLNYIVHYGDPPRHDCSGAGETMNCYDLKIKEAWIKEGFEFVRCQELEIELEKIGDIEI